MKAIDAVLGANIRNTQNRHTGTIYLTGYEIRPGVYGVRVRWDNGRVRLTNISYETFDKNTTQYELVTQYPVAAEERVIPPSTEEYIDWTPWYCASGKEGGYLRFEPLAEYFELASNPDLVLYNPDDGSQFFKPSEHRDLPSPSVIPTTPDVWLIGLPLGRQVNANAR